MSFQGQVLELPLGRAGFNGTKNQSQLQPDELIEATNVSFANGTLEKEGGAEKYTDSALGSSIRGGHDFFVNPSTQRSIVVLRNGTIKKDGGGGTYSTELASGLSITDTTVCAFAEGGLEAAGDDHKLFIFTGGSNQVQVLDADGSTVGDISDPATDWNSSDYPTFGINHQGRMWMLGSAAAPDRVYYSQASDHENFTGSGSGNFDIFPGFGGQLVNAVSFGNRLILFKTHSIYVLDTSSTTTSDWVAFEVNRSIGTLNARSVTQIDQDHVFLDQTGQIRIMSMVDTFTDITTASGGHRASMHVWASDNLSIDDLNTAQVEYYVLRREVHFAVPSFNAASGTNDRRMVMDLNSPERPRFRISDRDEITAMWTQIDDDGVPRLAAGDSDGEVWLLDQETRSKDGDGYLAQFQTPHWDLGFAEPRLATVVKNGAFLEVLSEPTGNYNLTVEVYWDGRLQDTLEFNLGSSGATLGAFVLGTDVLASSGVRSRRRRITGQGRRISLIGKNSGAGQNFSIARMYLHFTLGDERTTGQ